MRSLKLLFLSFFALIQLSSCDDLNFNVDNSGVYGVVIDSATNAPVPFATVHLNGPIADNTTADANGNYRFDNLSAGNYSVTASHNEYVAKVENVTTTLNNFTQKNIYIAPESMLNVSVLDFGTDKETMEIIVTNKTTEKIDVKTSENAMWLNATSTIYGIDPGQSATIEVDISRIFIDNNVSAYLTVEIEEDFGFDIIDSYQVLIQAQP